MAHLERRLSAEEVLKEQFVTADTAEQCKETGDSVLGTGSIDLRPHGLSCTSEQQKMPIIAALNHYEVEKGEARFEVSDGSLLAGPVHEVWASVSGSVVATAIDLKSGNL